MAALLWPAPGTALLGAALLALVGWLAAHDVARRTIRSTGLPRFMAACMLAGYAWLGVAGTIWLVAGPATAGARYDAVVHAVFLGFTLSMIMAHAPVILPTVLRRPLPYSPLLAVPPVLLHGSLVLRLWLGDAHGVVGAWRWGGVLNIAAVLLFVLLAAGSVALAARRARCRRGSAVTGKDRGFWPMRDLPVVVWLLAVAVVALAHPVVPAPRWLLIHLLLLGAVSHAILVWSRHFADALLHTAPLPGDRRRQSARLVLLDGGALLVVLGVTTATWPVTVGGAAGVACAVGWHGVALARQVRRSLPGRFRSTVRYYLAAAALLPVGAALGTLLARGLADPWDDRATLAHAVVNVLGWMGLTVVGTLVTLWPTMLRTRVDDRAERSARRALPVLVAGVLVAAAGALVGLRPVVVLGLVGYLAGLALVAGALGRTARSRPPSSYPTWSVAAALLWLTGCLVAAAVLVGTAGSWAEAGDRFRWLTPFLAAGFGAQVLLGALSYLVPVALGGGATPVRAANAVLDRGGALRVAAVNAGLLVCVLPVPSLVRVAASVVVLVALGGVRPAAVPRHRREPAGQALRRAARPARSHPARAGRRPAWPRSG